MLIYYYTDMATKKSRYLSPALGMGSRNETILHICPKCTMYIPNYMYLKMMPLQIVTTLKTSLTSHTLQSQENW